MTSVEIEAYIDELAEQIEAERWKLSDMNCELDQLYRDLSNKRTEEMGDENE